MAEDLYDGEFCLPPQFLTDDDILADCFGPISDQSSPVESLLGSAETESDEDEFLAGLTRKMARSKLENDSWKVDSGSYYENSKTWVMDGSPQSTLCSVLNGSSCKQGSSRGSTNCSSQVSSPPSAAGKNRQDVHWDLLYAAAGEVAKMRGFEGRAGYNQNRGIFEAQKPNPASAPLKNPNSNSGFQSNHSRPFNQFQTQQYEQWKQQNSSPAGWRQQMAIGQYQQNQSRRMVQNQIRETQLSSSAWPTLQQAQKKPGTGMRSASAPAEYLGNPGVSKRESTGTGVFIPQAIGTQTVKPVGRKKQGCSTIYVPARVVQALNSIDSSRQFPPNLYPNYALQYRNNVHQDNNNGGLEPVGMNVEIQLPQEWTY